MDEPEILDGALRIALEEYPDLDVAAYRARIEEFGREARGRVTDREEEGLEQFNDHFFGRLGFRGNVDDYYDPRNSYVNDVIDRRLGIPITLSAVYCEIARRAGLAAWGVGFPGHFLVRASLGSGDLMVDCFGARILTREDCRELLRDAVPGSPELDESMFEIASPRDILSRMLNNLRRIHASRGDFGRVARWIGLELAFRPGVAENYRDRGMAWLQAEEFGKALEDFDRYLKASPGADDAAAVREQVQVLRRLLTHLN